MAMLVNPSLYSHVQQQLLSNPNFMQACQNMFADGGGAASSKSSSSHPSKVASETQVVPSNSAAMDDMIKQAILQKPSKEQQQNVASARSRPVLTQATKPIQLTTLEPEAEVERRTKPTGANKSRFNSAETSLTESQQQEIALTQELIRRQLALTQQQPRNQRNQHSAGQSSISLPLSRHIPLTTEQMQEVLTRAKNYVTRQQTDETSDPMNSQPRVSYNTRRLQAAIAATVSSATPQTAHTIGQAAAAAIAAVSARPSAPNTQPSPISSAPTTITTPPMRTQPPPNVGGPSALGPMPPGPQQHPIRIQLDQKSKTLSSISNNQSLPIPTISQQKLMPLTEMNHSAPPHMYSNPQNWQRPPPPHLSGPHYPMPPPTTAAAAAATATTALSSLR